MAQRAQATAEKTRGSPERFLDGLRLRLQNMAFYWDNNDGFKPIVHHELYCVPACAALSLISRGCLLSI